MIRHPLNLVRRRYNAIWDLLNSGLTHQEVARRLGMRTSRLRAIIAESMNPALYDIAEHGYPNTPQRFYHDERFG